MSNDPLGLSYFWSEPPDEANYDAIYAAIVATDRGRWFLTEFASRNRHIDTRALVRAIGRVEGAIRGQVPPSSADVLCRDLIDLAAAIGRIEAELAAGTAQALDVLAASERIQDIAFALREREVSAALCDALDAAAREVADACARNDATTEHASQAALLLRDLGARVNDMIGSAMTGETEEPAPDLEDRLVAKAAIDHDLLPAPRLFGAEAQGNRNVAPDIATHGVTPPPSVDGAGLLGRGMTMYRASREAPSPEVDSDQALPINEIFAAPQSRGAAPAGQARHDALLPAMDLGAVTLLSRHRPAGPREDPADLFETPPPPPPAPPPRAGPASRVDARLSAPKPEQRHRVAPRLKSAAAAAAAAAPAPQPRPAAAAARVEARPGASDPMRAVRALTEAELIALFG